MNTSHNHDLWTTRGFDAFRRGDFGNGGQNLYVSKQGVLQRIYQFDLNHNGYFDLVFANCQSHHESPPAYVYHRDGTRVELPAQGAVSGVVADFSGSGYTDILLANNSDGAAPFVSSDIYYGSSEEYSEKYHSRIPSPWASSVAAGRFDGAARPSVAFALPEYKVVRIFDQKGVGLEWHRFTDLPIHCHQVAAIDLDGDGYDELIVRQENATATTIYWGGPEGIRLDNRTELPELPPEEVQAPKEFSGENASIEGRHDIPRLMQAVCLNGQNCISLSTGKNMILLAATSHREIYTAQAFDVKMAIAIAVGDLNGDGFDDVVIGAQEETQDSPTGQFSYVYLGGADGFSEQRRIPVPTCQVTDCAMLPNREFILSQGDFNRSYTNDALIFQLNAENNAISLTGRLQGEDVRRVFVLQNPGREPEILLVNLHSRSSVGSDHASIYWGGPDGFSPERVQEVPGFCAVDAVPADLDDDGWAELIVCDNAEEALHLDPGHYVHHFGPQGFEPEKSYNLPTHGGWGSVVADFNRDGYLDLVTVCNHYSDLKIFYGGPDGFTRSEVISLEGKGSPRWILAVDLNKNGYLDLIAPLNTADRTLILWGGPEGFSLKNSQELAVYKGTCARTADFTGNGYPDLVIGGHTETPKHGELWPHEPHHSFVYVYWNGPEGISENRKTILRADAADSIAIADFNNDGWLDMFVGSYHGGKDRDIYSFIYWNRQGKFGYYDREHLLTHSASGCVACDFNDDGYIDLAVANHKLWGDHGAYSEVWWNGPDGFNPHRTTKLPTEGPHGITAIEPGNQLTRGPEEFYYSEPHVAEVDGIILSVNIEAELPPRTWVHILFRQGTTAEELRQAPWVKPEQLQVRQGQLLQYRLELGAEKSLRTPRVTAVTIEMG